MSFNSSYSCSLVMCNDLLDFLLPHTDFLNSSVLVSVHTAGMCHASRADGLWGEHSDQPLQTDADAHRSVWRTLSVRGVADSGWS